MLNYLTVIVVAPPSASKSLKRYCSNHKAPHRAVACKHWLSTSVVRSKLVAPIVRLHQFCSVEAKRCILRLEQSGHVLRVAHRPGPKSKLSTDEHYTNLWQLSE